MKIHLIALVMTYIVYIFFLGAKMFKARLSAIMQGRVPIKHFRSYQSEAPEDLQVIKNHFDNQFQVPILFLITCLSAVQTDAITNVTLVFGYLFIISRFVHSYIHLGNNNVRPRAAAFFVGFFAVICMWVQIFYHITLNKI